MIELITMDSISIQNNLLDGVLDVLKKDFIALELKTFKIYFPNYVLSGTRNDELLLESLKLLMIKLKGASDTLVEFDYTMSSSSNIPRKISNSIPFGYIKTFKNLKKFGIYTVRLNKKQIVKVWKSLFSIRDTLEDFDFMCNPDGRLYPIAFDNDFKIPNGLFHRIHKSHLSILCMKQVKFSPEKLTFHGPRDSNDGGRAITLSILNNLYRKRCKSSGVLSLLTKDEFGNDLDEIGLFYKNHVADSDGEIK